MNINEPLSEEERTTCCYGKEGYLPCLEAMPDEIQVDKEAEKNVNCLFISLAR